MTPILGSYDDLVTLPVTNDRSERQGRAKQNTHAMQHLVDALHILLISGEATLKPLDRL